MRKKEHRFYMTLYVMFVLVAAGVLLVGSPTEALAKSAVRLTAEKKLVTEGDIFTVSLRGISKKTSSGRTIKWKLSDSDVLKICKQGINSVKVKALEDGISTLKAAYKGKTYRCRLVRGRYDEEWPEDDSDSTAKPTLNASRVELHYISDYAIPYIGKNPEYNYSFKFKVTGVGSSHVKWSVEGDKDAKDCYRIDDTGEIHMFMGNDLYEEYTECTVVAKLSDGTRLTAKVRGYDDDNAYVRSVMENFKETYITPGMSEYEKMEKVAWYLSSEYDYRLYQASWYEYIITGSGDCMASRWAVMYFCRDLGLHAAACPSLDSHGMTVVRADGKAYLVTTGFSGKKPRYYEVREITRETFDRINEGNNIDPDYIWGD